MRPEFNDVYRLLYDDYTAAQSSYDRGGLIDPYRSRDERRSVFAVRDAVERGIARSEVARRLRPDARYFLLVNFDQMVVRPLALAPEGRREVFTDAELARMVEDDVQTILDEAPRMPRTPDGQPGGEFRPRVSGDEITGGQVVAALAEVYGRLKTMSLDVWG